MSKPRRIPQRMCVACRQMKDKRELARVVRSPEGWIFVDDTGKGAGRGAAARGKALTQRLHRSSSPARAKVTPSMTALPASSASALTASTGTGATPHIQMR